MTWKAARMGAVFAVLFAGTAYAQQPTQAQVGAIKQSCRADYQSVCSGVPTGGSAALQCLRSHMSALSPACQGAVGAVAGGGGQGGGNQSGGNQSVGGAPAQGAAPGMSRREAMAMTRRSCVGDFRSYCGGVPMGGGRAMACLAANQSRLSPGCKGALAELQGSR